MSRWGNCWDNAVMERFFRNLKTERLNHQNFTNYQEVVDNKGKLDAIVGSHIRMWTRSVQASNNRHSIYLKFNSGFKWTKELFVS
jgi:transposase InsO family protein